METVTTEQPNLETFVEGYNPLATIADKSLFHAANDIEKRCDNLACNTFVNWMCFMLVLLIFVALGFNYLFPPHLYPIPMGWQALIMFGALLSTVIPSLFAAKRKVAKFKANAWSPQVKFKNQADNMVSIEATETLNSEEEIEYILDEEYLTLNNITRIAVVETPSFLKWTTPKCQECGEHLIRIDTFVAQYPKKPTAKYKNEKPFSVLDVCKSCRATRRIDQID